MFGKKKDKQVKGAVAPETKQEFVEIEEVENVKETKKGVQVTKEKKEKVVKEEEKSVISEGMRQLKDFIAPAGIDRSNPDYLMIGNKYVRSFVLNGYPTLVRIGWLDDLFNGENDTDTAIHVMPADERGALDELTNKITQFEAQLDIESKKGNIRNITKLQSTINDLYQQRMALEQNFENLFHVQICSNLYENSKENLDKATQRLQTKLKGRRMDALPMFLQQEEAYKSALPIGISFITDKFRNFNSGALTSCFPFYNSEISHKNGVFIGVNLSTGTPVLLDFYDRSVLNNSNMTVFGQAGSGKTFFVSLLTLRSALRGVRTIIIDPEGEYRKVTQAVGGAYIKLAPNSNMCMNPMDIAAEDEVDDEGVITGRQVINIKQKVADVLNLIAVMSGGITKEQEAIISYLITDLYERVFGFTEDPESLYNADGDYDEESGTFGHRVKKRMPQLSDFYTLLKDYYEENKDESVRTVMNTLKMFVKGGIYDLFDCQTAEEFGNMMNLPIVDFDVSQLEEGVLRPIGMYVALTWSWEKFIKGDVSIKKRILVDEAWMLVKKGMAGSEFTAQFLENCARRIRKRNGGLLVASQNFAEFAESSQGRAVLTNAVVNIFLKQNSTDIEDVQETFKLSDGEKTFLMTAKRGEMLIRMSEESSIVQVIPFDYEKKLIVNAVQPTRRENIEK